MQQLKIGVESQTWEGEIKYKQPMMITAPLAWPPRIVEKIYMPEKLV